MRALLDGMVACLLASGLAAQVQNWEELGPAPIANGPYTGRIAAIAASRSDAKRIYVGGADGGVWRSDDAGASWQPIGDHLPSTSVGALAVDPKDHDVLYVGTGEANFAYHSRYGVGIVKTSNGGQDWERFGEQEFGGRCISRIVIDPANRSVLYAASTHAGGFLPRKSAARGHPGADGPLGVFRSGDAGKTWKQLVTGIPTDLSATDLAIDPANSGVLYAAFGDIFSDVRNGIYRTTDGGASWTKLTQGLPTYGVGRISLALAASRPQRLYAIFVWASDDFGGSASTMGVYRSDDSGASWSALTGAGSFQSSYGWYLSVVGVAPTDPDAVVVGGLSLRRSSNGGAQWDTRTPPHVDIHALEWDAAGRLLCGNDGGIHATSDLGDRWISLNANLGLIQIYAGISLHPQDPAVVYAGFQDNGSARRTSGKSWTQLLGGDGGYTGVDPTATRVFAEYQGTGNLYRSVNGGSFQYVGSGLQGRNCFLPPYEIDPQNPLRMVYGSDRVYLSTSGGTGWTAISPDLTGGGNAAIHGIALAPSDGNYIYVKTNDGRVQVTENGGQSWQQRRTGVPGWFRVTRPFTVHPLDPKRVYLSVGWYGVDQILYSPDAGRGWQVLDGDLPDMPAHSVGIDTTHGEPPIVYLGTEWGVWRCENHDGKWTRYGIGLPRAPVIDLRVDTARRRLVVATQGRGCWQTELLGRGQRHGVGTGR